MISGRRAIFDGSEFDNPEDKRKKKVRKIARYFIGGLAVLGLIGIEYSTSGYSNKALSYILFKKQDLIIDDKIIEKYSLEKRLNTEEKIQIPAVTELIEFYKQNKGTFTVKYEGDFDINNDGILERFKVFEYGNARVIYANGIKKELSAFELEQFFVGSVFEKKDIDKYFMAPDGKSRYRDFISDEQVKSLQKKDPNYVSRLRELGKATGLYTKTSQEIKGTDQVFESRLKRLEEMARF